MNECYLIGKVVSQPIFEFLYNSQYISICYFTIELEKNIFVKVFALDRIADYIYQKININKYVCIEGKLCDNTKNFSVEISNIQLEQSNFRSSSALADLGFKGENSKGGSDCSILIY